MIIEILCIYRRAFGYNNFNLYRSLGKFSRQQIDVFYASTIFNALRGGGGHIVSPLYVRPSISFNFEKFSTLKNSFLAISFERIGILD